MLPMRHPEPPPGVDIVLRLRAALAASEAGDAPPPGTSADEWEALLGGAVETIEALRQLLGLRWETGVEGEEPNGSV